MKKREFISWWQNTSLEEYLYHKPEVLIKAINKKIEEIKKPKELKDN